MKIAQLVSNYHRVAPETNQAIYSHAAWLTNGLVKTGNEVHLYASGDSVSDGTLHFVTEKATLGMELSDETRKSMLHMHVSECYQQASQFDIVHSHLTLIPSFYADFCDVPTVQSLHSAVPEETKRLMQKYKNHYYVSFTQAQRKLLPELNWVDNVYHGINTQLFQFNPHPQDYLLYLGRITEEKGVHLAIEAAKAVGKQLLIAGFSYPKEGYWQKSIEQHIDGKTVRYVGNADFATKIEYLKNAKALLFPTQYMEVFGLVMIEAMACGTPVVGLDNGSVSEVVKDRETGFVVKDVAGMVKAVKAVDKIDRQACRDRVVSNFSVEKMVAGYEKVYVKIIEEHRVKNLKNGTIKIARSYAAK